jgi:hypothetical protein
MHLFMVSLNPRLRSFVVCLVPHPAGSLGEKSWNYFQEIAELLKQSNMHIIVFSSDSDPYTKNCFLVDAMLLRVVVAFDCDDAPGPPIWWIADCFMD